MIPFRLLFPAALVSLLLGQVVGRLVTTEVLGISGFAASPYIRATTHSVVLGVLIILASAHARTLSVMGRTWRPYQSLALLLLLILVTGAIVGAVRGTSNLYLVTDSGYLLLAAVLYLIGRNVDPNSTMVDTTFMRWMVLVALSVLLVTALGLSPGHQLRFLMVCAAFAALTRPTLRTAAFAFLMLLPAVAGIGDANRASVLAYAIAGMSVLLLLKGREFVRVASLGLLALVIFITLTPDVVTPGGALDRRIRELGNDARALQAIYAGDPSALSIPVQQRLYEVEVAVQTLQAHAPWSVLVGMGAGATIDMRSSQDAAVTRAALLGAAEVHNIHLLPIMLVYRHGLLGFALFVALIVTSVGLLLRARRWRRTQPGWQSAVLALVAIAVYIPTAIVYAMPAGGHLLADPLLFLLMGVVDAMLRPRVARTTPIASRAGAQLCGAAS